MNTGTEHLIVQREGPVGVLVFNRPERHNAPSLEVWRALPAVLAALEADAAVRVLIVRGAGDRAFVAGADSDELDDFPGDAAYTNASAAALAALSRFKKPSIALIHGHCAAAGVALALACDMRFASDDARFAMPAARLGHALRTDTVCRLARVVGPGYASEILFSARSIDALEARRMQLVNHVVAASEVEDAVEQTARQIADNAPLSLLVAKLALHSAFDASAERELEDAVVTCLESADRAEGRRAYRGKRKPRYTGA